MSKFLSLSILLLLISCSHSRVEQLSGLQTVELNLYDADIIDPPVVDSKDSVGLYGPESGQQSYSRETKENESVAIVVGPAIYNTIESLRVFQCMNKPLDQSTYLHSLLTSMLPFPVYRPVPSTPLGMA